MPLEQDAAQQYDPRLSQYQKTDGISVRPCRWLADVVNLCCVWILMSFQELTWGVPMIALA